MTATDPRLALLEQRRERMVGQQVDNGTLPAGSPMYYYCQICGTHVATLPEDWYEKPPPKHCEDCRDLIHDGVIDRSNTFKDWESAQKAT